MMATKNSLSSISYNDVQEYYGKILKNTNDLKTTACTTSENETMSSLIKEALSLISDEVISKYYGCGICLPPVIENCMVLDLGCGAGRDCFCLSKLVGEGGWVTGLDMTDEQLQIANRNIEYHIKKFGYTKSNVEFKKGYMENLTSAGIHPDSYDVIISNCVINLSPNKKSVLSETFKVLKDGGELYFSDVYADQQLPDEVRKDKTLWGECVAGALFWKDLHEISMEVGFARPRLVSCSMIDLKNDELQKLVGCAQFISATYRLFKISKTNDSNKLAKVTYLGGIDEYNDEFKFDFTNSFKKNVPVIVNDVDLVKILKISRFGKYFSFEDSNTDANCDDKFEQNPFLVAKRANVGCCGKKVPAVTKSCCGGGKC